MAEVKECDGKEKWQAIIKASHPNMTQTALTWHPTATVRNTSTLKLRSALSTLWFHGCENQQRAILFPPASHPSDLSQPLCPFWSQSAVINSLKSFKRVYDSLMGGSLIIRSSERTHNHSVHLHVLPHNSVNMLVFIDAGWPINHYLMSWLAVVVSIFISIPSESKVMAGSAWWIVYVEQKWESGQLYLETCMWAMFAVFNEAFWLAMW